MRRTGTATKHKTSAEKQGTGEKIWVKQFPTLCDEFQLIETDLSRLALVGKAEIACSFKILQFPTYHLSNLYFSRLPSAIEL